MPELPEVEVLVRKLRPLLVARRIRDCSILREKSIRGSNRREFDLLKGAAFAGLERRGKYLLFTIKPRNSAPVCLLGHLGMTGRMYLQSRSAPLPKHAALTINLGDHDFVFEDPRYFGRMTFDISPLAALGPEALDPAVTTEGFWQRLRRSSQPIKVRLLDQGFIAGVGNIYASESLHLARIHPGIKADRLTRYEATRLLQSVRRTLETAIEFGSTIPLNITGGKTDGLFYFGTSPTATASYEERLLVYGREGEPCHSCGSAVKKVFQAGRSTFFCPSCQPSKGRLRSQAQRPVSPG